jgi:hypothetical protein
MSDSPDREAAPNRTRTGLIMLGCSLACVVIMILMWRSGFDLDDGESDSLFVWVFVIACGLLGLGLSYLPKLRRRLKT